MSYAQLNAGESLKVDGHIYASNENLNISDLVLFSVEHLKTMEQGSIDSENELFSQIKALSDEWKRCGIETCRIRAAMDYLRTPPIEHTSNEWVEGEYGWHDRSNMVYKMRWGVYERTHYNLATQQMDTKAWVLTWFLAFNVTNRRDYSNSGGRIAGQSDKVFKSKEAMQKYLDGRIKAYDPLFREISPPVPPKDAGRFSVHGCLLPGYTVDEPELTSQEVVNELLGYLDDNVMPRAHDPVPAAKKYKSKHRDPVR